MEGGKNCGKLGIHNTDVLIRSSSFSFERSSL